MAAKKGGLGKGLGSKGLGLDALIPEIPAEKKTVAQAKEGEENERDYIQKD